MVILMKNRCWVEIWMHSTMYIHLSSSYCHQQGEHRTGSSKISQANTSCIQNHCNTSWGGRGKAIPKTTSPNPLHKKYHDFIAEPKSPATKLLAFSQTDYLSNVCLVTRHPKIRNRFDLGKPLKIKQTCIHQRLPFLFLEVFVSPGPHST